MLDAQKIINSIESNFAAGISGGADSMCLLFLILKSGKKDKVTVLNVSHGIRKNSCQDQQFVQDFCKKNGIKFLGFKIDVPTEAKKNKNSIETQARLMRQQIFYDYCRDNNVPILLAHNKDDNVESILMHIFRGCGINGLVGMGNKDGHIIRPLLGRKKSEICQYLKQNNVPYVEDETNTDISYRRNHIRALIPEIEKSFPSVKKAVISLSDLAKKHKAFLDSQLNQDYFIWDKSALLLDKKALDTLLASEYVLRALEKIGIRTDFEQKHINLILELANLENGKSLDLPHGLRVYNEYSYLAFEFFSPISAEEKPFVLGLNQIGDANIFASVTDMGPTLGKIIVDGDKLSGARVRFRKAGDVFTPIGGGSKKLKEYLNEQKIPLRKRDRLPLITLGKEVLVVGAVQLSEKVKITEATRTRYLIETK